MCNTILTHNIDTAFGLLGKVVILAKLMCLRHLFFIVHIKLCHDIHHI